MYHILSEKSFWKLFEIKPSTSIPLKNVKSFLEFGIALLETEDK